MGCTHPTNLSAELLMAEARPENRGHPNTLWERAMPANRAHGALPHLITLRMGTPHQQKYVD